MPEASSTSRAADQLARRLAEAGCRHAFGIPGGEVLTIIDALGAAGITFVTAKHETAAGFMAEAVWQRTGTPPVLVATVGPGLSNAVNVVANARLDRVPLIVLAGCVDPDDALTYNHQLIDHARLLEPAIKGAFTLTATAADLVTEKALTLAMDPRPGPVLIDVPIDVAAARSTAGPRLRRDRPQPTAPAEGPALDDARFWLAEARRPLLIAGYDAVQDGAGPALRRFAERHRVPVVQTYKAKGLLPEDHPMALGAAALSPAADAALMPLVEAADLVVLAGYDAVEMRRGWQQPWDPEAKHVVAFETVPNDHYLHLATTTFVCSIGAGLEAFGQGATDASTWTAEAVARARATIVAPFMTDEDWGPAAVAVAARSVLPRDTVATADVGAHRILLSQVWEAYEPRGMLQSNGLCTMGCGLPLAIGAKLAEPERPVVAFTGDGGLLMVLGELATVAELGLPIIVVCFVDHSLALIDLKQQERQLRRHGVAIGAFDAVALAGSLGGHGVIADSRESLAAALRDALGASRFTLIACPIAPDAYQGRL
jgi:acetolactate synthase-1/2/3 large subunit